MSSPRSFHKTALIGLVFIAFLLTISVSASSHVSLYASGLNGPFGMAFDSTGDLYVANEYSGGGETGISIVDSDGIVLPFATGLNGASGLAFNSAAVLHVSDDTNSVYSVDPTGILTTFIADTAGLENPNAIAFDQSGNIYIASANGGFISKFDPSGTVVNLHLVTDLHVPQALVVDDDNHRLFFSEMDGDIFQITLDTEVMSLYARTFAYTQGGLVMDGGGNLYLSAYDEGYVLRIDATDQAVTTCLSGLYTPRGLAIDGAGSLYVTSYDNGEIHKATTCGTSEPPPPPPTSFLSVEVTTDQIWGGDWQPNSSVEINIGGSGPYTSTTDGEGNFNHNLWGTHDIEGGQLVVVSDSFATKSHIVTDLTITEVNHATNVISGTSSIDPLIDVCVDVWYIGGICVTPDPITGNWTVDVTSIDGVDDIGPGSIGTSHQTDADGNNTEYNWRIPNPAFDARPVTDWIQAWDCSAGETVSLTIDDPATTDPVDYSDSQACYVLEWDPSQTRVEFNPLGSYDLKGGDFVTLTFGVVVKTHTVFDLVVTEVDLENDILSGTSNPNSGINFWICDSGGCTGKSTTTSVLGTWSVDFGDPTGSHGEYDTYDIVPGTEIGLEQPDGDGDNTRIDYRVANPRFSARPEDDYVEGWEWLPGTTVNVTADGFTGYVVSDDSGNFSINMPGFDLQPGQVVNVNDGDSFKSHTVTDFTIDNVDHVNDIVSGTADEGTEVLVWLHEGCDDGMKVTANPSRVWTANFTGICEIEPGTNGGAVQEDEDGDNTYIGWSVPAPYLRIQKGADGQPGVGGNFVFQIYYNNAGNAAAENTIITDTLSSNLVYISDSSGIVPTGSGSVADPLTWDLGTLPPNSSGSFDVFVQVTGSESEPVTNTVEIATSNPHDQGDPSEKNFTWEGTIVANETDLNLWKGSWTGDPAPDSNFVFNINVCNNGSTGSNEITLTDTWLPIAPAMTFVEWWSQHPGWLEVDQTGNQLVLTRPSIPGNWCGEVYLKMHVDSTAYSGMDIYNTATIEASNDTTPGDNESTWEGQVSDPHSNLYIYKRWNWGQLVPGGQISYYINIGNDGNVRVDGPISITDTLPVNTTFNSAWHHDLPGQVQFMPTEVAADYVVWEIDGLDNGYSTNFEVILDVDPGAAPGTLLRNTIEITQKPGEDRHDDNIAIVDEILRAHGPNLRVRKWHGWNGDWQLNYNIRVENVGDVLVEDVFVTDMYPAGTTYSDGWGSNFWREITLDDSTPGVLSWWLERLEPGWSTDIWFNVDLIPPLLPLTDYTNNVDVTIPPGDSYPDDNTYTDVATSPPELDWVELYVDARDIWGCGPDGPVSVSHVRDSLELERRDYPEGCFNDSFEYNFEPLDVITITAGAGHAPVIITIPDPFSAQADSSTEIVSGQIDNLDHEQVEVELDSGPFLYAETDGSGYFSATFTDIPRGGSGEVRYRTDINYTNVTFRRRFYTPDLIMIVDYGHDWVAGNYESGHPIIIRVTDSEGTEKASAELVTGPIPDWGGQSGFNVHCEDWDMGECPDIQPGDWVFGDVTVGETTHSSTVQVGAIDGEVDVEADTVSGNVYAAWLFPGLVTLRCEIHEHDGPSIQIEGFNPDGGEFFCDFSEEPTAWDLRLGTNLAVNYQEPDGDRVQNYVYSRFLRVKVNQSHDWIEGWTTPGSTIVATIWRDGLPVMAQMTENGGGWSWGIDFCCGDEYEIRAGDIVEIETSLGLTAWIEVIPMTGVVDAVSETISGWIDVDYEAPIAGNPQGGDWVNGFTDDDNSGNYSLSFDPYNVLSGHNVELWYIRPDGHMVGISKSALRLDIDTASDVVSGETAPNIIVTVSIGGEDQVGTSDEEGYFHDLIFNHDIVPYDTVVATAGDQVVSLVIEDITANIDEAEGKVWGNGPPSSGEDHNINVGINDDWQWTSLDTAGYYEVDFDYGISQDDRLQVDYRYPDNHSAKYGFGQSDVRVDKWAPIWNVSPGDVFTYIISFNNDWSGTATGVQIIDTLPPEVSYVPNPADLGPTYDPFTHALVWDIGTLGGYRGREIELQVQLDGGVELGSRLNNYVEIFADEDRNPENNISRTTEDVRPPGADFWVRKEIVSGHAVPGGEITYRVYFGNGATRTEPAIITDLLPDFTSFVESTFEVGVHGLSETVESDRIIWDLGDLEPSGDDQQNSFEFKLLIAPYPDVEPGDFLTNEISISPDTSAWSDNRDNRRILNTIIEPLVADLWIDKTIEGDFSSTDAEFVYRITFGNNGNSAADGVTIIDTLPPEMSHIWHSAGSADDVTGNTVTWNLGSVPAGAMGELAIGVRLSDPDAEPTLMVNHIEIRSDPADQNLSNNQATVEIGLPSAIAVPWVGDDPHRIWSGLDTTLKGVAKGYGLTHYEWDFGDGSPPETGPIDDPYAIEARHTYVGDPGDTFVATLTVWGAFGWSDSDQYHVGIFNRIHGVEKDVAIDEALWYQHKSAYRYRREGLSFADWSWEQHNRVAMTATAVQAFQIHGHGPGGDPMEDPYVEDVRDGWNWLFTHALVDPMSLQNGHDPDYNSNGVGIGLYEDYNHSIYEAGLAMMALASTGTPDAVALTGPVEYVRGRRYDDIAQDMADWFAWAQNDTDPSGQNEWARGGWRYQPNSGDSDNSNTQFPVLGLAAAEDNWGITVPDFVKDELRDYWLNTTQNWQGGFGYDCAECIPNVGKTGAGIMNLIWTDVPADDARVLAAAGYIQTYWDAEPDPENYIGNVGDFYAMYAVKKGSQLAGIVNYGDQYWDYEYTSYLVDIQAPDGHFDEDPTIGVWFHNWQPMSTSWALLILSEGLYEALPVAIISPYQYGTTDPIWYEGEVQFDGSLSHHTDPDHIITTYSWDFGDGGTSTNDPTPYHTYDTFGQYEVSLTVWDDDDPSKSDTDTLRLDVLPGFLRYCVYANEDVIQIEESAHVHCNVGGEDYIELKLRSRVYGDVVGRDDILISKRARVSGDAMAAGEVKLESKAKVEGEIIENADIPPITQVTVDVLAGGSDFTVPKGSTRSLTPGTYKLLKVEEDGILILSGTHYTFEKIEAEKNAKIVFELPEGEQIFIDVADTIDLKEGVVMESSTDIASDIIFRVAGSDVKLGKEGIFLGNYIAPNAHIDLHEDAVLTGMLYGRKVQIKKNAVVYGDPALDAYLDFSVTGPVVDLFIPYFNNQVTPAAYSNAVNAFASMIEDHTGMQTMAVVPSGDYVTSQDAVLDALNEGGADIGMLDWIPYLIAHEASGAEAFVGTIRFGDVAFRSQLLTYAGSGIEEVGDIAGRQLCWTDPNSTSGYIVPSWMLMAEGVDPDDNAYFTGSHGDVVRDLYNHDCDAGATYVDARNPLEVELPDVHEEVVQLATSPPIPNTSFIFSAGFPADLRDEVETAILAIAGTSQGAGFLTTILGSNYGGVNAIDHQLYSGIADLIASASLSPIEIWETY